MFGWYCAWAFVIFVACVFFSIFLLRIVAIPTGTIAVIYSKRRKTISSTLYTRRRKKLYRKLIWVWYDYFAISEEKRENRLLVIRNDKTNDVLRIDLSFIFRIFVPARIPGIALMAYNNRNWFDDLMQSAQKEVGESLKLVKPDFAFTETDRHLIGEFVFNVLSPLFKEIGFEIRREEFRLRSVELTNIIFSETKQKE